MMTSDQQNTANPSGSDPPPNLQVREPQAVVRAIELIWLSWTLQLVATVLEGARDRSLAYLIGASLGFVLATLLQLWIIRQLKAGRNWMRMVLLACALIALAFIKLFIDEELPLIASLDAIAILNSVSWFANLAAVPLLFFPDANRWFRSAVPSAT
jgi:hypothetical protein